MESQEARAEGQKQGDQPSAITETGNPPLAHMDVTATVVDVVSPGDRDPKPKRHASRERSADRRFENRSANEKNARARHRRNIRRSNTNG